MPTIPLYSPAKGIPTTAGEVPREPTPIYTQYQIKYGEALQRFGEGLGELGVFIAKKRGEAKRTDLLQTKSLQAEKEIVDLDLRLREQENFGTVVDDYEKAISDMRSRYTDEIRDPIVRRAFLEDFNRSYLHKRLNLQIYQKARQADFYRAGLITNLEHLKDIMATSSGPTADLEFRNNLSRGYKMIAQGARAGFISAVEAQRLTEQWPKEALKVRIQNDIMLDPEQAFKDIMSGEYETLDPEDRPELEKAARTEWHYRVSMAEEMDREAERAIKEQQDRNSLDLLIALGEGRLNLPTLNKAGKARAIDDVQYRAIYNMMTRGKTIKSDPGIVLSHIQNIDQGRGDPQKIFSDAARGLLNPKDTMNLLDRNRQWSEREEKGENEHIKWGKTYLESRIKTTGPGSPLLKIGEDTALSGATDELDARVRAEGLGGWNIRRAAVEIAENWATTPLVTTAIRKVRGSRPKSLAEIEPLKQVTIKDLYDGKIDDEEAARDMSSLLQYEAIFQQREAAKAQQLKTERRR